MEWNIERRGSELLGDSFSLSKPWATQVSGNEADEADASTFETLLHPEGCNPSDCQIFKSLAVCDPAFLHTAPAKADALN